MASPRQNLLPLHRYARLCGFDVAVVVFNAAKGTGNHDCASNATNNIDEGRDFQSKTISSFVQKLVRIVTAEDCLVAIKS